MVRIALVCASAALALLPAQALAQGGPPRVSLAEATARAAARSPSARAAELQVARADALVRQARAASLPTLTANAVYTRLDSDRALGDRVFSPANQLNANLQLTVPVFAPRAWGQWRRAEDQAGVTRAATADVRRQLGQAVGRAYLAVVTQRRVLQINVRARDAAKAHFDFAHQRLAGGVGNKIDEVRAEQALAASEALIEGARAGLSRAQEALGVATGEDGPLDAEDDPRLSEAPALPQALGDTQRRADVSAQEVRVRAAERAVKDEWREYMPLLSLVATPFYQEPPTAVQPRTGWQAQLVLSVPLFDGGARYGVIREREVALAEAREATTATLRQARAEVRTAWDGMLRADAALASARRAAQLAHQALDLAEQAYRAGATTNIEVIDAERRAADADTQAAMAEDSARQARLDLLLASGRFP